MVVERRRRNLVEWCDEEEVEGGVDGRVELEIREEAGCGGELDQCRVRKTGVE